MCRLVHDHCLADELSVMTSPTGPFGIDAGIAEYGAETRGGPRTDHTAWRQMSADAPGRVRDAR